MLMTYGRGRAEQFRLHPTPGSALNFVPPLFCAYLLTMPFLLALTSIGKVCLLPLACYVLAVLAQALVLAVGGQMLQSLAAIPLIVLTHILYGLGFWRGLFTALRRPGQRPPGQVLLETVPL
jgi:amino acid permease